VFNAHNLKRGNLFSFVGLDFLRFDFDRGLFCALEVVPELSRTFSMIFKASTPKLLIGAITI
jgi:hypothetical protein